MALQTVPLEKFYRLLNHGPTVMVSAKSNGIENVMSVAWSCALDFYPKPKVTVVLDKSTYTRSLVEASGYFALQVPFAHQAKTVIAMGESRKDNPNKIRENGIALFYQDGFDIPLVKGCSAYILCKLIPEPHNHQAHDLFIGEVLAAFADDRVFRDGHWQFDEVGDELKNLHYVAGGQFYLTGKGINVKNDLPFSVNAEEGMTAAITKQQVLEAFRFRAATRRYDPLKKVSREDFDYILELARLSPSSVGSEPWQFLVVQNPTLREKLKPVSWGAATQLDDASYLVVILAKKNARYDSAFFRNGLEKRGLTAEQMEKTIARYKTFQEQDMKILDSERTLFDWTSKQTYIALGNMMTGAALIGIDSCPIEGFDYDEVNRILAESGAFDPHEWGVSVMVTFGYRAKEIKSKYRKPLEEIINWVE